MSYRVIIWAPGYAENHSIGHIISSTFFIGGGQSFSSKEEAITSLAQDLWNLFSEATDIVNETTVRYKPQRAILKKTRTEFARFIRRLPGCTTDNWGGDDDGVWSPFWVDRALPDITAGCFVHIDEQAEIYFVHALKKINKEIFEKEDDEDDDHDVSYSQSLWEELTKE